MGLTVDGGINSDPTSISAATRPSDGRRAGGWMGRYVKRHLKAANRSSLDSFLLIHTHSGHIGDVTDSSPMSSGDTYKLTGPMDVDPIVPVDALIDRSYPLYDNPTARTAPLAANYSAYVKARVTDGRHVERFRVGRDNQIRARDYVIATRNVDIRNFSANGKVCIRTGTQAKRMFPALDTLIRRDYSNENVLATAIRLRYGNFGYLAIGDLTSFTCDGALPWTDVLTAAARGSGPVDVAVAARHSFYDGLSADAVRMLRPQAWMHVTHPDLLQWLGDRTYPGHRDVFGTTVMPENLRENPCVTRHLRSIDDGQIVVRVAPDGGAFNIFVTGSQDQEDRVKLMPGRYSLSSKVQGA
jgi:hypothetical protein